MEEAPQNALVPVRGGSVTVGRKWDGTRFYGWDNEFGAPVEKELRDLRDQMPGRVVAALNK